MAEKVTAALFHMVESAIGASRRKRWRKRRRTLAKTRTRHRTSAIKSKLYTSQWHIITLDQRLGQPTIVIPVILGSPHIPPLPPPSLQAPSSQPPPQPLGYNHVPNSRLPHLRLRIQHQARPRFLHRKIPLPSMAFHLPSKGTFVPGPLQSRQLGYTQCRWHISDGRDVSGSVACMCTGL